MELNARKSLFAALELTINTEVALVEPGGYTQFLAYLSCDLVCKGISENQTLMR